MDKRFQTEITLLNQFHAQKALFKVPKICHINFWIENDPTPLDFSENLKNSSKCQIIGILEEIDSLILIDQKCTS